MRIRREPMGSRRTEIVLALSQCRMAFAIGQKEVDTECGQDPLGSRIANRILRHREKERCAGNAPLTNGLADNRYWVLGAFYVNRDEPSIFVERRFGFGYTIHFGNPKAAAFFLGFIILNLALAAAAMVKGWGILQQAFLRFALGFSSFSHADIRIMAG